MKNVAVIGAGQMGSGITQYLALQGITVTLVDYKESNIDNAKKKIEASLVKLVSKGKISEGKYKETNNSIRYSTSLDSCEKMYIVIEAIPENIEKKKELFKTLSNIMHGNSILATNTSSLSITKLSSMFIDPSRVIGLHFFNPVLLMPLVEIIRGLETSKETLEKITSFVTEIEKEAVYVQDQSGFIVNRILIPMINEAIFVYQEGIATPEEIDKAMKLGSNHPMGPLELADFIGLDTCLSIMETLHTNFGEDKYRPAPLLRKYVEANRLGRKTKKGFYIY